MTTPCVPEPGDRSVNGTTAQNDGHCAPAIPVLTVWGDNRRCWRAGPHAFSEWSTLNGRTVYRCPWCGTLAMESAK